MINLMYVVLMAMLAMNVSTEVLNGFSIVSEGLDRSTVNATKENLGIYADFDAQMNLFCLWFCEKCAEMFAIFA